LFIYLFFFPIYPFFLFCSSLCQPLLDAVSTNPLLEPYVYPLKRVVFHKLIVQLSRVYSTLSIKHFTTHICTSSFLPWSEAEKLFVAIIQHQQISANRNLFPLTYSSILPGGGATAGYIASAAGGGGPGGAGGVGGGLSIRLDYSTSSILFETPDASAANTWKHQLCNLAKQIDRAVRMIAPGQSAEERIERMRFLQELPARLEAETRRMAERTRITHSRRLEQQEEQQKMEEERRRKEAEQRRVEEKQERERREEATRRREERRMQQEKIKQRSETAAQMLEEIKKIGGKASSTILIKGKQLGEINIDDVLQGNVDYDDLEKAQLMQINRERIIRLRQRRQNYRRVCHFIRACREEELPLLIKWQEDQLKSDTLILLDMQNKHEEEHKAAFEAALEEKQIFEVVTPDKEQWVGEKLRERQEDFEKQARDQHLRLVNVLKQQKIQRARARRDEHIKKMKFEAEKKRMEEEQKVRSRDKNNEEGERQNGGSGSDREERERKRESEIGNTRLKFLEQMEKKKQEEEAKAKRLAEQAEKQRQRELEIEEKQRQLDREASAVMRGGGGNAPSSNSINFTRNSGNTPQHNSTSSSSSVSTPSNAAGGGDLGDWRRGGGGGVEKSRGSTNGRFNRPSGDGGEDLERWRDREGGAGESSSSSRPRFRLATSALTEVLGSGSSAPPSSSQVGGEESSSSSYGHHKEGGGRGEGGEERNSSSSAGVDGGAGGVGGGAGGSAVEEDDEGFTTVSRGGGR
ncbi:eukaryotic initiation factor-3 subunit, partial [Cystoisospora suis]